MLKKIQHQFQREFDTDYRIEYVFESENIYFVKYDSIDFIDKGIKDLSLITGLKVYDVKKEVFREYSNLELEAYYMLLKKQKPLYRLSKKKIPISVFVDRLISMDIKYTSDFIQVLELNNYKTNSIVFIETRKGWKIDVEDDTLISPIKELLSKINIEFQLNESCFYIIGNVFE